MYFKKHYIILFLRLLLLCSGGIYPLFANFVWPLPSDKIDSIETKIIDNHIFLSIQGTDAIVAISDGIIVHIRKEQENGLPSMISMLTKDALLISYVYIDTDVHIGQKVLTGETIGYYNDTNSLLIKAYDITMQLDIDILSILPYIKRPIRIKLQEMAFYVENEQIDTIERYDIGRRIKSGNAKVEVVLYIADRYAVGTILPDSVSLQVKQETYLFQKYDIWDSASQHMVLPDGNIKIIMPDVYIPRGYFDIRMIVKTPLGGVRRFKFNVFGFR